MQRTLRPWIWMTVSIAACAISWSYMHRILLPWEKFVNVTQGRLKAQLGDLYPRWIGTRELLLHGQDPYGAEVSHEIQIGFYGHPIEQSYDKPPSEIIDEQRFAYPIYVIFLLAPTVHVEFASLQEWAAAILALVIAIAVWLWVQIVGWRLSWPVIVCLMLFVIASPQLAQGLRLRQLGLLVGFLIALAAWCVTRRHYAATGVLLAISTIKPQIVPLLVVWFLLWALGDLRQRWPLLGGFSISLGLLVGAGELLVPRWPIEFLHGVEAYRRYFPITSPLRFVLGDWIGGLVSILIIGALIAIAWQKRAVAANSPEFVNMLALFFVVTSLVLPVMTPNNQVLLLLPTILLLRDWNNLPRAGQAAFAAIVAWPWLASLVLLFHPPSVESRSRMPLLPSILVLLFPFLIAGLLFVRFQNEPETHMQPGRVHRGCDLG